MPLPALITSMAAPMIGSALSSLFSGNKGSAESASPYLNQIPGIGRQYYEPYIQPGMQASNLAREQYDPMTSDPVDYLNSLMSQYKPSQGYQYREKRLRDALGNTAAAGGYRGTQQDQMAQAELVNALMGSDMQQFLQNVGGIQERGLRGQESMANRGFQASGSLADYLGTAFGKQGELAATGAREQIEGANQMRKSLFDTVAPALGTAASKFIEGAFK